MVVAVGARIAVVVCRMVVFMDCHCACPSPRCVVLWGVNTSAFCVEGVLVFVGLSQVLVPGSFGPVCVLVLDDFVAGRGEGLAHVDVGARVDTTSAFQAWRVVA